MLNISEISIDKKVDTDKYQSFSKVDLPAAARMFGSWLLVTFFVSVVILFLPWTQNIRAKGKVTTLTPDQRPQMIHSTIAGRIEKWYVREGQLVRKGDTIVFLSETKTDYFDPSLLSRTAAQIAAKENSVGAYNSKANALAQQITAMRSELKFKKEQLVNKIMQARLKAEGDKNDFSAAVTDLETEQKQLLRTEEMYKEGLTPLTAVENKRLKLQQTQAKKISADNKYRTSLNEIENADLQLKGIENEYQGKIAKTESEKFSTLSDRLDSEVNVQKLKNQYSNYELRSAFYHIVAPRDGYITKVMTPGIGETVKEGEAIVSIVPADLNLAVEMFIDPIDLPLANIGAPVRFIFDGWPAFIFSGWPNASVGTYAGRIFAIENAADEKGQYRILVAPDSAQVAWPSALRPGSGAQGMALLQDVAVWYELWRQLNGFPPDFYKNPMAKETSKETKI